MSVEAHPLAVVHQLSNRRLFQAAGRALDAVTEELTEVRARTGSTDVRADEWTGIGVSDEFELGLRDIAVSAAYQASMRTAATVRQRSLAEFLQ